jgi:two-component system cell cycle response regulator
VSAEVAAPASTVMVVDDSGVVRAWMGGMLEEQGYLVVEAADGREALDLCMSVPPDVILLDIEMPGLNGYQVLELLKAEAMLKDIPVVFVTSHSDQDDIIRGLLAGGHDFLSKPPKKAELMARVGAAMRVKQLQNELNLRNQQLDKTSRTDVLTGLFNRRHLVEQLTSCISTGSRRAEPVGVLLFDVDHFKHVNDTYGHSAGDTVLIELASRLSSELRAGDVAGRWGGEEFLVILPSTGLAGTVEAGERIRSVVAGQPFLAGDHVISVTISGGGASGIDIDDEALVHRADTGLYEAKDRGRNCVVVTVEAGPPVVTGTWLD